VPTSSDAHASTGAPDNPNAIDAPADFHAFPDAGGHFGRYGGSFVSETLVAPLEELCAAYDRYRVDPVFQAELAHDYRHYVGRPSPIYEAVRLSREVGGARILLKREDLNHTGAHKINNTIGQAMLPAAWARRESLLKRVLASMASRRRRWRRAWGWSAWSTWARWTSSARPSTCSA
jgi:tryptophan synthase beta chain